MAPIFCMSFRSLNSAQHDNENEIKIRKDVHKNDYLPGCFSPELLR